MLGMTECRFCGKPIVWGVDEKGVKHRMDPRPPIWHVMRYDEELRAFIVERAGGDKPTYLVDHFSTCSGASAASKKNRAAPARDPRAAAAGD